MKFRILLLSLLTVVPAVVVATAPTVSAQSETETESFGLDGTIPTTPPTTGATITLPTNGSSFTTQPVTVSGLCPANLLVKVFKNGVFAGAAPCTNGSYSVQISLFSGTNELVAIVYDALNQAGPPSNTVVVQFNSPIPTSPLQGITLSSDFARRGANPGEILRWPLQLSGGSPPYAVSVDWGDGSEDTLLSIQTPGEFNVEHIYEASGVYIILVKVTDSEGRVAYLQLVGVGNGPLEVSQDTAADLETVVKIKFLFWPLLLALILMAPIFWLGKRYELKRIKDRISRGEQPFKLG